MNAYTFTCRDSGPDCPGAFTTESKEELIEHVQFHAREAHQKYDLSPQDIEQGIKVTSMSASRAA